MYSAAIPCGLVVRIRRFHRRGRGSIPRMGAIFFPHSPPILSIFTLGIHLEPGNQMYQEASVVQW